jgi:transglutaminase-like putative cysteine protease
VRSEVEYVPGSTGVQTSAQEAWTLRKGVCQDIAQLTVGLLRQRGIPARYVSGYLHPKREAEIGQTVEGQSHAWVEWWCGDWVGYDPTNGVPVGPQHVVVARGRDYEDVPPLKGVYHGPPSSHLGVSVEITRVT